MIERAKKLAGWIERDRREPDKVLMYAQDLQTLLEEPEPRCPVCPICKEPLTARPPHRRFMEDDYYVECVAGHAWDLMGSRDGVGELGKPVAVSGP